MQSMAPFLAGLGLFFFGVHFVSANLVPLAGRRFRKLLSVLGRRVPLTILFGTLAGVITQSTNAVTSVIIGLISGGLVDKRSAILIPTWAHVGTSVLVILVAIDLRMAASYLVALAGAAVYFRFDRDERMRHAVGTLLGIGMLFLGLQMLKAGADPLRDHLLDGGFLAAASQMPAVLLVLGAGLSLACQSSSVAGALAVAGAATGLLGFDGAAWVVYGANLGAAGNYALLARAHQGEAAQIAWMQAAQKFAGFFIVVLLMAAEAVSGRAIIAGVTSALATTVPGQIAWLFLIYQLLGSGAATVLATRLVPLLEQLAPPSALQELSKPAYLIDEALVEPSVAIELAAREERRLLERLPTMLDAVRADVEGPTAVSAATLREAGTAITREMAAYLDQITELALTRTSREQVMRLQHRVANLTALHEALDDFVTACEQTRHWPSSARVAGQMIESLHTLLTAFVDAATSADPGDHEVLLVLLGHRDEMMERIRQRVLREDPDMPPKAQEALFSTTMLFERIVWLARRNALLLTPEAASASGRVHAKAVQ